MARSRSREPHHTPDTAPRSSVPGLQDQHQAEPRRTATATAPTPARSLEAATHAAAGSATGHHLVPTAKPTRPHRPQPRCPDADGPPGTATPPPGTRQESSRPAPHSRPPPPPHTRVESPAQALPTAAGERPPSTFRSESCTTDRNGSPATVGHADACTRPTAHQPERQRTSPRMARPRPTTG